MSKKTIEKNNKMNNIGYIIVIVLLIILLVIGGCFGYSKIIELEIKNDEINKLNTKINELDGKSGENKTGDIVQLDMDKIIEEIGYNEEIYGVNGYDVSNFKIDKTTGDISYYYYIGEKADNIQLNVNSCENDKEYPEYKKCSIKLTDYITATLFVRKDEDKYYTDFLINNLKVGKSAGNKIVEYKVNDKLYFLVSGGNSGQGFAALVDKDGNEIKTFSSSSLHYNDIDTIMLYKDNDNKSAEYLIYSSCEEGSSLLTRYLYNIDTNKEIKLYEINDAYCSQY